MFLRTYNSPGRGSKVLAESPFSVGYSNIAAGRKERIALAFSKEINKDDEPRKAAVYEILLTGEDIAKICLKGLPFLRDLCPEQADILANGMRQALQRYEEPKGK